MSTLGKVAGFSLHASVAAKAHERNKLECLYRHIARPAVSEQRLSLPKYRKYKRPFSMISIPQRMKPFSTSSTFPNPGDSILNRIIYTD